MSSCSIIPNFTCLFNIKYLFFLAIDRFGQFLPSSTKLLQKTFFFHYQAELPSLVSTQFWFQGLYSLFQWVVEGQGENPSLGSWTLFISVINKEVYCMKDGLNNFPSAAAASFSFTSTPSPLANEVRVYWLPMVCYRADPQWCHPFLIRVECSLDLVKNWQYRRMIFLHVQFSRDIGE